jgi:hypothetical protein
LNALCLALAKAGFSGPSLFLFPLALWLAHVTCVLLVQYLTAANSYPLAYSGLVEVSEGPFKGHRWAEPSGVDLQRLMRHVYDNPEEAKAKGRRARQDMLAYAPQAVNRIVLRRLRDIEASLMREGKLPTKERGKGKSGSSRKKEERVDL